MSLSRASVPSLKVSAFERPERISREQVREQLCFAMVGAPSWG